MTSPKARRPGIIARLSAVASELVAYVRNPVMIDNRGPMNSRACSTFGILLLIKILLMLPLGIFISVYRSGVEDVASVDLGGPDWGDAFIPAFFVLVVMAPLMEETLFRGWLRAKPAGLMVALCVIGWVATLYTMMAVDWFDGDRKLSVMIASLGWLGLGIYFVHSVIDHNKTPELVRRYFAWLFWISTSVFALAHVSNYDEMWLAVPMTVPQFASGAILGFVRMHYGLRASISMHALYNLFLLSVIFGMDWLFA